MPVTVALDQSPEDARPYVEKARPSHPSLIDPEHKVAELYNIVNVPTVVWIDEAGRVVRPNDTQFGTDTFAELTGKPSGPFLAAVRAWARDGTGALADDDVRARQLLPSPEQQLARAEFTLAWHLHRTGREKAAVAHFDRAGEYAPHDWTIRRGSMPIRGIDSMTSPEFLALWQEWDAAGRPAYPEVPLE